MIGRFLRDFVRYWSRDAIAARLDAWAVRIEAFNQGRCWCVGRDRVCACESCARGVITVHGEHSEHLCCPCHDYPG